MKSVNDRMYSPGPGRHTMPYKVPGDDRIRWTAGFGDPKYVRELILKLHPGAHFLPVVDK